MTVTRSEIVKKLSAKTGYWQKDIEVLLRNYDDLMLELMNDVTEDNEVSVQVIKGIKVGCTVVPERERVNPRTKQPITVKPTVKPFVKWSEDYRKNIQDQFDAKKYEGS